MCMQHPGTVCVESHLADDEEVGAVAGGHEAVGVQHQRLVSVRLLRLQQ